MSKWPKNKELYKEGNYFSNSRENNIIVFQRMKGIYPDNDERLLSSSK